MSMKRSTIRIVAILATRQEIGPAKPVDVYLGMGSLDICGVFRTREEIARKGAVCRVGV
jgi:hypothetical protein